MKAEIVCIGTELLLGHIVNTNNSFIAKKLAEIGVDSYFQTTVGDNPKRLADTIRTGLERADIVITTGGLGPTVDDITTRIIAEVAGRRLILETAVLKELSGFFKRQNKKMPKDNLNQALIPEGARWLRNPFGTAPGFIIECGPKAIIALPGPPREMEPMMRDYVGPYLESKVQGSGRRAQGMIIKSKSIKLTGIPEVKVNGKVKDLLALSGEVTVGIYSRLGEVELKIMAKAHNEKHADIEIKKIEKIIQKRFKEYIYGVNSETLEAAIVGLLIRHKKTISTAESCTGGLISNRITDVPGSSRIFMEGVVSYSNRSKTLELNVRQAMLKKYGAVSSQVAVEMARGIRKKADVDIGIGITGIAGPSGGTKAKPAGLVYIALSRKNGTICRKFVFLGSRKEVKHQAAQAALNLVRLQLRGEKRKAQSEKHRSAT